MVSTPEEQHDHRIGEQLARALGLFSVTLGAAQVVLPGGMDRLVGLDSTPRTRAVMRGVGLQEFAVGAGILSRRRPTEWLWARVAGDAIHLLLLSRAMQSPASTRSRVGKVTAAVVGVTLLDLIVSARMTAASEAGGEEPSRVSTAITINRPPDEVYRHWRDLENLPQFMFHLQSVRETDDGRWHWVARAPAGRTVEWDAEIVEEVPNERIAWRSLEGADVTNSGAVRFSPAPGGRGTEVALDLEYVTPAGAVGAAVAKIFGEHPEQQAKDDLRRFKQVLETGEVVRSDGSPDGSRTQRQWRQGPAQPPT
ncbi:MAG: SRPBCC family protein [Nitriliruptorales bacterium]